MRVTKIARAIASRHAKLRWEFVGERGPEQDRGADPHVPGPGCSRPMPKKVAVRVAHSGARGRDAPATAGGTPALLSSFTFRPRDLREGDLE